MTIVSQHQLLRHVPLFAGMSDQALDLIAQKCTKRRFRKGEILIIEGTTTNSLFILIAGRAVVTKRESGVAQVLVDDPRERERQIVLAHLVAGDYVGEMSLLDGKPHSATVTAEALLDVFVLQQHDLHHCLQQEAGLAIVLMRGLVRRLRMANEKIELLALKDVSYRVSQALWSMARACDDSDTPGAFEAGAIAGAGEAIVAQKVSKQAIGKMVGASREMVTRVMKDLEKQGLLRFNASGEMILSKRSPVSP